jgi:hypothetical protein
MDDSVIEGETGLEDAFTVLNINPTKSRFFGSSSSFQYMEVGAIKPSHGVTVHL